MRGGEMRTAVTLEGKLPRGFPRRALSDAASYFARRSSSRCGLPFREVAVVFQNDGGSSEVHEAVMGDPSATDVITQRYEPLPHEPPGVYGELYVNVQRAREYAASHAGCDPFEELLLYVAHGMDHLSGADDLDARSRAAMRRRELGWIRDFRSGRGEG